MGVLITGNTYPVKDQLREMGGKWRPAEKAWEVPADKAAEAQSLVNSAPKSTPRRRFARSSDRAPHGRTCPMCGARDCPRAWNSRDLCQED